MQLSVLVLGDSDVLSSRRLREEIKLYHCMFASVDESPKIEVIEEVLLLVVSRFGRDNVASAELSRR